MSTEANKQIVRRYFEGAVDKRNADLLDQLFAADCVIHRPEVPQPIVGLDNFRRTFERVVGTYSHLATTIYDMVAEGDRVAVRLHHKTVNRAEWNSRIGRHDVAAKPVSWAAMAIFRIHEGKIAEEWVCRDELGMLIELGVLPSRTAP